MIRRALGALDVNIASPNSRGSVNHGKLDGGHVPASPLKLHRDVQLPVAPAETTPDSKKRVLAAAENTQQQPAKKARRDEPASAPRRGLAEAGSKVESAAEETPDNSQTARERSVSPGASSLFDSSGLESTVDTSQTTAITEPDADTAPRGLPEVFSLASLPPLPPRRKPTREESRHKAEILKLRLGLANYKVRTGQTDVPLEKLQVKPYPGMKRRSPALAEQRPLPAARATQSPSLGGGSVREVRHGGGARHNEPQQEGDAGFEESEVDEEEEDDDGDDDHDDGAPIVGRHSAASSPEKSLLPRMPMASGAGTPQRRRLEADEERLTSSALRGGAVSGLLSLARS